MVNLVEKLNIIIIVTAKIKDNIQLAYNILFEQLYVNLVQAINTIIFLY